MKKTLLSLILLFTLLGCGAKDSVKEQISDTETTDVTTFVKEMDGVSGSISRLLKPMTNEEKVEEFYTKYYNPFMQEINKELGRSSYENDAYFKFDKYGNVLEVGIKFRDGLDESIQKINFKPTENNIPVFMHDWENMAKYIDKEKYTGVYTYNYVDEGITSKYYDFQSDSERVSFEIKDGTYINHESNNSNSNVVLYDNLGRLSEIEIGSSSGFRFKDGDVNFYFDKFIDDEGTNISLTEQVNGKWVSIYKELRFVFDYASGKVKLYNGDTYLGIAKDASVSWVNNQFKVEVSKNVWVESQAQVINEYININFDSKKRVVGYEKESFDYSSMKVEKETGTWLYDSKYGILEESSIYFGGLLLRHYEVDYELVNGLVKKFVSTDLYQNKKYNNTSNSWEIIEEEPVVVTMDYTRNPSNNKITSVYTNINLGSGININGVFKPKK